MAIRSVGEARISFGLVSIPVNLYTATSPAASISFNMLHGACGTRVKQQLWCPTCEMKVERSDTVKGYEYEKGKFVKLTAEELEALEVESTQQIDIEEFLPLASIDPVFYDKPYYLGTDKGGEKPYHLLAEALLRSQRAAIGTYSARGRNYLVVIRPRGPAAHDGLVMQELLYSDEVRPFSDVPMQGAEVREQEVKLALQIIDQGAKETFDPTQWKDERRAQVQALIDEKIAGHDITHRPKHETKHENVIDLVAVLEASLKKDGKAESRKGPKKVESPVVAEKAKPKRKAK